MATADPASNADTNANGGFVSAGDIPQPEWSFETVEVELTDEQRREAEDRQAGASLDGGPSHLPPPLQVGRAATMPPGYPPGLDARDSGSGQRSPPRFLNRLNKQSKAKKKNPHQAQMPKLKKLEPQEMGAEPGLDLRDAAHADLAQQFQQPARVTGVEFSAKSVVLKNLTLTELIDFVGEDPTEGQVRWLNLSGIQWEFLHALAMRFDLHPLAIEDTLTVPQRTKVDFYDGHIYMCVPVMFLTKEDEEESKRIKRLATRRSLDNQTAGPTPQNPWGTFLEGQVDVQQCSIFLLGGRTLVTIFMGDSSPVTGPILGQLRQERTLVRNSGDASFLMYRILDNIVDHIQPIVDEYDAILDIYEQYIKSSGPTIGRTLNIYSQQRELIQINRTVAPMLAIVSNLKQMDSQQCQMLSQRTGVYLNDIIDHLNTVSDMLREQADECRDLISLIFNITAHRQSISTQTLAIVSVIFLPITFLAGVYGVNFTNVPELEWEFGYAYFWAMCIVITILFAYALFKMGMFKTYS